MKQLVKKAREDEKRGSTIAISILRVHETFLIEIYSTVLAAGLARWCPDIHSPPDTAYNKAHAIVYTKSFKAVASAFAYRYSSPSPSGINNPALINDLLNSYVFSYMKEKARVEASSAGKLVQIREESNASRRRKRVR